MPPPPRADMVSQRPRVCGVDLRTALSDKAAPASCDASYALSMCGKPHVVHQCACTCSAARVDPAVLRATSVVDVTVSPDLRAATATVTTRGDAAQTREAFSWLVANAKGFRYALAQRLRHSKRVPEVTFRKADVGGAVALMRLIDEANEGVDDDVIEGGLDFGLDLDEYDDED